ncbi:hypothetical protein ACMZ62_09310 [Streptococcus pluranimalium]|uniref:hypothetical protein n=1 Tax=Streptococcus hyovaginalis TaxID=149015 RepID=UPI00147843DD|nr:hypothetical protein [Streptococcus hyovaginalis]MDY3024448.1 hypothetical protein [Streptococcus hyovaginalis]
MKRVLYIATLLIGLLFLTGCSVDLEKNFQNQGFSYVFNYDDGDKKFEREGGFYLTSSQSFNLYGTWKKENFKNASGKYASQINEDIEDGDLDDTFSINTNDNSISLSDGLSLDKDGYPMILRNIRKSSGGFKANVFNDENKKIGTVILKPAS